MSHLEEIKQQLEEIVCTEGEDRGVILKSWDSPMHLEKVGAVEMSVYDHQNFSELGDALIKLYDYVRQALRDEYYDNH